MSELIKLTQEQAEAIEKWVSKEDLIKSKLVGLLEHGKDEPVAELTLETLVKALYIGYEVEETFEVGDWVVYNHDNTVWEVIGELYGGKVHYDITRNGKHKGSVHKDHIRLATPSEIVEEKQRRWWAGHGRDAWELKENDLLISKHDRHSCQVKFVEAADEYGVLLVGGIKDEFYEGEHDLQILQDRYKVICFAEDRKDLESDEE